MSDHDDDDAVERRTIGDMAGDDDALDPDELFPLGTIEGDPGVTLKTLIKAGHSVVSTVTMNGTSEIPAPKGGLLDPNKEGLLLVTYEVAGYKPVPQREGERAIGKTIKGWKIQQQLRPIHVERVDGNGADIEANFAVLMDADEKEAGALLDRLRDRLSKKLAEGRHPAMVSSKS